MELVWISDSNHLLDDVVCRWQEVNWAQQLNIWIWWSVWGRPECLSRYGDWYMYKILVYLETVFQLAHVLIWGGKCKRDGKSCHPSKYFFLQILTFFNHDLFLATLHHTGFFQWKWNVWFSFNLWALFVWNLRLNYFYFICMLILMMNLSNM